MKQLTVLSSVLLALTTLSSIGISNSNPSWASAPWYADILGSDNGTLNGVAPVLSGEGVHVYILSQGTIKTSNPEFQGRATNDFAVPGSEGCSTAVTAIAAVLKSLARNVTLHGMSVVPCSSKAIAYSSGMLDALNWIKNNAERPAVVVTTLSTKDQDTPYVLEATLYDLVESFNFPFIASSGFLGKIECGWWPGRAADITTVGAVSQSMQVLPLSNEGACVRLFAPGSGIFTFTTNSTVVMEGTALAAALTTAVAAQYLQLNPNASSNDVHMFLQSSAVKGVVECPDPLSPNAFLHISPSLLDNSGDGSTPSPSPSPPPPFEESPDPYINTNVVPPGAFTADYSIDEGDDYEEEEVPTLPSCQGFLGEYYLLPKPLASFAELEQATPNVSRTDKWIWFPSGAGPCAWDLPWPAVANNDLVAVFSAYLNVGVEAVYKFQLNTPLVVGSKAQLFIDGKPAVSVPSSPFNCLNTTTATNQGDFKLSGGTHFVQLFFQRSKLHYDAGLAAYITQLTAEGNATEWYPLGGSMGNITSMSLNTVKDNGVGCSADYTGYRQCRCYNCAYNSSRPACEDFCPGKVEFEVLKCRGYKIALPPTVLKFSKNWKIVSEEDSATATSIVSSGEASEPSTIIIQDSYAAKTQNYEASALQYNMKWWLHWHQCQVPVGNTILPPNSTVPKPNWAALRDCASLEQQASKTTATGRRLRQFDVDMTEGTAARTVGPGFSFQTVGKLVVIFANLDLLPHIFL